MAHAEIECDNTATQTDMNICSFEQYKQADKKLNEIYQKALSIIGKGMPHAEKFRENQRAWIKYRDLTCNFEAGDRKMSGTIWPLVMNNCMLRHTNHRIEEIPHAFQEWSIH